MSTDLPPASPIGAFTADQVCELTELSQSQLRYWDKTGFFKPEAGSLRMGPYSRVYSFRDVVGLRTLALLRQHTSLQALRSAADMLHEHNDYPWANLRFYKREGEPTVFFEVNDETFMVANAKSQTTFTIDLQEVSDKMLNLVRRMRERKAEEIGQTSRHRYIAHNQRVIAGTRIPTSAIWNFHKAGYRTDQIIKEYPRLEPADVDEAIRLHEAEAAASTT